MPRPECPRCGSGQVVAAAPATPSESVLELRSGTVRVFAGDHWLCSACGHQWEEAVEPDEDGAERALEHEPTSASLAAELRGAREQRGRSLADAAVGTKIQERHLRALERDAPIDAFPSPAYARFFLREYAEYLRLDPAPLLREFDARHEPPDEEAPIAPPPVEPRKPRTGWGAFVVLSVVALILIAVVPSIVRSRETATPPPPSPSAPASPALVTSPTPTPSPPAPDGIRAVLELTAPSWVEATIDGTVVEHSTLQPGTSIVYRARDLLQLTLGNAGGVVLRVNGEPVETGGSGDVVTLHIAWRNGEVRIQRA